MAYIGPMKRIVPYVLLASLTVSPFSAQSQTESDPGSELEEGLELLSEGAQMMLRSLLKGADELVLKFEGKIIDLSLYQLPEILENGDIIIRRRQDLAPIPQQPEEPGGEIDL
ncbi:hypothetical protein [Candidatus Halocynthiibacter alkanivorans]|uniref:hypothetical protein n=1 Tax=Candidatus Halocynthiibacter alkanivorans TaxID=2267619 RepID=UPI000DF19CDC|nr:hypothetical protein [Candidatus Halocynthiibacter alkanivorans]